MSTTTVKHRRAQHYTRTRFCPFVGTSTSLFSHTAWSRPSPLAATHLFSISIYHFAISKCYVSEIIICDLLWLAFSTPNNSLDILPSFSYINCSFLFIDKYYFMVWTYPSLLNHSPPLSSNLRDFFKPSMSIHVWTSVFIFLNNNKNPRKYCWIAFLFHFTILYWSCLIHL